MTFFSYNSFAFIYSPSFGSWIMVDGLKIVQRVIVFQCYRHYVLKNLFTKYAACKIIWTLSQLNKSSNWGMLNKNPSKLLHYLIYLSFKFDRAILTSLLLFGWFTLTYGFTSSSLWIYLGNQNEASADRSTDDSNTFVIPWSFSSKSLPKTCCIFYLE